MGTLHLLTLCLVLSIVSLIQGVEILSTNVQVEPLLALVGNNGSPSGAFPLKLCQG
jgi:hypothetical protein